MVGKANQANTWSQLGTIEEAPPQPDAWAQTSREVTLGATLFAAIKTSQPVC